MGIKDTCKIRIEYGLFEWMVWYPDDFPEWCTKEELSAADYNIDMEYESMMSIDELRACTTETCEQFYNRNHTVIENALNANGVYYFYSLVFNI